MKAFALAAIYLAVAVALFILWSNNESIGEWLLQAAVIVILLCCLLSAIASLIALSRSIEMIYLKATEGWLSLFLHIDEVIPTDKLWVPAATGLAVVITTSINPLPITYWLIGNLLVSMLPIVTYKLLK